MTKHTPGPWLIQNSGDALYIWSSKSGCRGAAIAKLKVYGQPDNLDFDTSERIAWANAEFIVNACNSYDNLLKLCQDVKDFLDHPDQRSNAAWVLISRLEEAISQANKYHPSTDW